MPRGISRGTAGQSRVFLYAQGYGSAAGAPRPGPRRLSKIMENVKNLK